jgi:hypothetical protein
MTQHTPGPWYTDGLVTKDLDIISPDGRIAWLDYYRAETEAA